MVGRYCRKIYKYIFFSFAIIFFTINFTTANAQPYCSINGKMSSNGWKMISPGNSVFNGQIIGSTRASIVYTMPIPQNSPRIMAGSVSAENNEYNAIPMPQTPGIGVRIKWAGHSATSSINVNTQASYGTILTRKYWQKIFDATSSSSFLITFYYDYEIVIIDQNKYKGGKLIITDSTPVTADTHTGRAGTTPQQCIGGWVNLLTAVTNELNIPPLPEPSNPTCAAAEISFNNKMSPINVTQVAPYGSNRSEGTPGELAFTLVGRNCKKGTVIKAYLTDTRAQSGENYYIYTTNPTVALRFYHDQNQHPIQMTPAPVGSTLPLQPPIIGGPATSDMASLYIPITAQYVRLSYIGPDNVQAGAAKAAATVTFVYD